MSKHGGLRNGPKNGLDGKAPLEIPAGHY